MTFRKSTGFDAGPARVPAHVLALVGERLAVSIATAQVLWLRGDADAAQHALDDLQRLGLQLQQVTRQITREGGEPLESVDLGLACRQAVADWQRRAEALGTSLQIDAGPLTAIVDAAALALVLDLVVDHAVAVGAAVSLGVEPAGQGLQASLQVQMRPRTPQAIAVPSTPSEVDELPLGLAQLVALAHGLVLHRTTLGGMTTWVIGVPMVAQEPLLPDEVAMLPRTPGVAGGRVLIVDPRSDSRAQAHQILHAAGMNVDAVDSVAQAHAALRDGEPDVLLVGLSTDDEDLAALIDQIRATAPRLRVIELVDAENAFALSPPGAGAAGRLSRSELAEHLGTAVAQEMFAARGT